MKVLAGYVTSKGTIRSKNEDSILIHHRMISESEKIFHETLEDDALLFAVADGMGGHLYGDIASQIVLKSLTGTVPKTVNDVQRKILQAKSDLETEGESLHLKKSIGTTLSGMVFCKNRGIVFHSGDSRIYRLREGSLKRVTRDHTYVQELVDLGKIHNEDARFHPRKNLLLKAVMSSKNEESDFYDISEENLQEGDVYLLCTDGLWETMSDEEIISALANEKNEKRVEILFEKSFEIGRDNISIIVAELIKI